MSHHFFKCLPAWRLPVMLSFTHSGIPTTPGVPVKRLIQSCFPSQTAAAEDSGGAGGVPAEDVRIFEHGSRPFARRGCRIRPKSGPATDPRRF